MPSHVSLHSAATVHRSPCTHYSEGNGALNVSDNAMMKLLNVDNEDAVLCFNELARSADFRRTGKTPESQRPNQTEVERGLMLVVSVIVARIPTNVTLYLY